MTLNERAVITKALAKAAGMGLGIEDTVNLIELYQDVINDVGSEARSAIVVQSEFRPTASPAPIPAPPPPPPVIQSPKKPVVLLSATSAIGSDVVLIDRTLDECVAELKEKIPAYIDILGPGRTAPARFKLDVYRREAEGIVPASFGVVLTAAGDPSVVEGKFTYDLIRPYDVDKDIAEFREAIISRYKNAGKKLVPMLPPVQLPANGLGDQWA